MDLSCWTADVLFYSRIKVNCCDCTGSAGAAGPSCPFSLTRRRDKTQGDVSGGGLESTSRRTDESQMENQAEWTSSVQPAALRSRAVPCLIRSNSAANSPWLDKHVTLLTASLNLLSLQKAHTDLHHLTLLQNIQPAASRKSCWTRRSWDAGAAPVQAGRTSPA